MGRVRRQRRLKSIDPFAKGSISEKDGDQRFNLDPGNDNDEAVPRKAQQIMTFSKIGLRRLPKTKKKKSSKLLKKPGESTKQFFNRLDQQVGEALNNVLLETKKLREKRKDHLKKRDQKQRLKRTRQDQRLNANGLKSEQTDHVKFGEVVSQPPTLSAVPRKDQTKKASLDLKLVNLIKKENGDSIDKEYKLKRKEMTEQMKKIHDIEREKAIKEYRKMKQRKSTRS